MQYVIDERQTVHAIFERYYSAREPRTLACGHAGQWRNLSAFPEDGALCEFCALYMLPETTIEGFHLPTLARLCRVLRHPTNDGLAALVWRLSCVSVVPPSLGADFMRACGYKPFVGFPLQRSKTPNMEEVKK
jgi:hypothetical protein